VCLPIRRSISKAIIRQVEAGIPFNVENELLEKLDWVLNYSLQGEFRAPTPAQVRFVYLIAKKLGLEPIADTFENKGATENFIETYHPAFKLAVDLEFPEE